MLFSYHLLYFCTALSLIIMLSSHYHHHKSKTFSQLTQCPFTGTLLFLPLNNYLVTLFHNTICRAQLFCRFLLSASEYFSNMLFSYHLLYFCTALSLIIMLSSHYHLHKSKTQSADTVPVHGHSPLVFYEVACHSILVLSLTGVTSFFLNIACNITQKTVDKYFI